MQSVSAGPADETNHTAALPIFSRKKIAVYLELLNRVHGEHNARGVEPGTASFHAVDEIAVRVSSVAGDVHGHVGPAGLVRNRRAPRIISGNYSGRDVGKLQEVASVQRQLNDILSMANY